MDTAAQPATSKPRVTWTDSLRVFAAFAIVTMHVALDIVAKVENQDSLDWWTGNIIDSACRWALPVFVMISGAFLLGPSKEESAETFWKKRLKRICAPLVFWSLLYGGLYVVFTHVDWKDMLTRTLVFGRPASHLWYLYMTVGLYLLTPFLRTYISSSTGRERQRLVFIILVIASLHSFFAAYFYEYRPASVMLFAPYLGYYLCGYQLREAKPENIAAGRFGLLFTVSVLLTALGTGVLTSHFGRTPAGFFFRNPFSPTVIVMSIAAFLLCVRLQGRESAATRRTANIFVRGAPATLGIYVLHPLVAAAFKKALGITPLSFNPLWGIPILSVATFLVSYLFTVAMMKVPYLRRTVS